jgi:methyl-accepting chemotaxis protein
MRDPVDRAVRAISRRNSFALVIAQFAIAHLVVFVAYTTWLLHLEWWDFFVIAVVGSVALIGGVIIRYFTMEIVTRPVLERIAERLPPGFTPDAPGLPLRWRLLAAAPAINVITAVVVAGLSSNGQDTNLSDLGVACLIAVGVSFTLSLELAILAVRSLGSSLNDLRTATERVRAGDFSARVPVVSSDDTGRLAQSFNTMVEGLDERERLRAAIGAYVDPGLPVLLRHGGHANKFIGDGLLGVFGVPDVGIGVNSGPSWPSASRSR